MKIFIRIFPVILISMFGPICAETSISTVDIDKAVERQIGEFAIHPTGDELVALVKIIKAIPTADKNSSLLGTNEDTKLTLILEFLKVLENLKDPAYGKSLLRTRNGTPVPSKYLVFINVPPPLKSGIIPGEDPAQVKDPKLKKEYEDIIAANKVKAVELNLQSDVYNTANNVEHYASSCIFAWYKINDPDQQKRWREIAKKVFENDPNADKIINDLAEY